ncbi:MAG: 7-carboxy-7-deazaguanine synthase QueE [Planctomycetes bacterium]|nr:7-carboxy-7-deazaguanine synthase QueE [Planctomycetota bacterium]
MRIAELFQSIQGEGEFCGTTSVFVRTTGCNLRCWFCDTPYTSWQPEGMLRDWRELLQDVLKFDCQHVVLTGGEPLLQATIVPFSQALRDAGRLVTVETAGTVFRPVDADLMSISPKMSNSSPHEAGRWQNRHERDRRRPSVIRELIARFRCQFKFVIDQPSDLDEVQEYLREFSEIAADQVWLMPQGVTAGDLTARAEWLAPAAAALGFRLSPRQHIELFGHVRGT